VRIVREAEWELAWPTAQLDSARGLGELSELPPASRPGDWCTIVAAADDGEIRWTFVARELERTTSIFVDRRHAQSPPEAQPSRGGSAPLGDALGRADPPGAGARRRAGRD